MRPITTITVHPEIQEGAPVFSGTHIQVETFFDYMRIGVSMNEFLNEFPSVSHDQAQEALFLANSYSIDQIKSLICGPSASSERMGKQPERSFTRLGSRMRH